MWEPQQPRLQTSQTAAPTIDPQPAYSRRFSPPLLANCGYVLLQRSALDKQLISYIWGLTRSGLKWKRKGRLSFIRKD